ncbi:Membrane transporter [Pyrenophora tritici-repentis]|nr:Membrane transporter [Pyrenophora tritici-repentis]
MYRASWRASRFQDIEGNRRHTLWPSAQPGDHVDALYMPWAVESDQRVVSVFDTEGRAARMSAMMDSSLFPPPFPQAGGARHSAWIGQGKRDTWLERDLSTKERVWTGEFDVERRPSWQSHRFDGQVTLAQLAQEEASKVVSMETFAVNWEVDDVENPLNFTAGRKWFNAMLLAFACFMVSIASSGFSQGMYEDIRFCSVHHLTISQAQNSSRPSFTSLKLRLSSLPQHLCLASQSEPSFSLL